MMSSVQFENEYVDNVLQIFVNKCRESKLEHGEDYDSMIEYDIYKDVLKEVDGRFWPDDISEQDFHEAARSAGIEMV